MKNQANVVICPPCGEQSLAPEGFNLGVAVATKEGRNRKNALWPLLPRLTAVLPPQGREMSKGFTLIELLVVVLIIGILAAVAVPQYQLVVLKARFSTIKALTNSLAQAESVYYLANGNYAISFDALDVDIPAGSDETESTRVTRTFDWGMCRLTFPNETTSAVSCALINDNFGYLRYQIFLPLGHGTRWCQVGSKNLNNVASKVCQRETGTLIPYDNRDSTDYVAWKY